MCRGLAILVDKHNRVICEGFSSHSKTANSSKHEDKCLKFEVIVTDKNKSGYMLETDPDEERKEEAKAVRTIVMKWIKDHEMQVLRWLLHNQSYATRKGNTNNSYQETEGNTNNSYQITEGNTNNSCQETKRDTDNSCQETKRDTHNSYQKTEGDTYNSSQETEGDTDNSYQKTGKEWYCGLIELNKYPRTTELIKTVKDSWKLTIVELLSWVANNPEKAKKIMGKELVKEGWKHPKKVTYE